MKKGKSKKGAGGDALTWVLALAVGGFALYKGYEEYQELQEAKKTATPATTTPAATTTSAPAGSTGLVVDSSTPGAAQVPMVPVSTLSVGGGDTYTAPSANVVSTDLVSTPPALLGVASRAATSTSGPAPSVSSSMAVSGGNQMALMAADAGGWVGGGTYS